MYALRFFFFKFEINSIVHYKTFPPPPQPFGRDDLKEASCFKMHSFTIEKITVIKVYALTSDHGDEGVKQFYKQLDSIIANTSQDGYTCSSRRLEFRVGPDSFQHWAGTMGRFGIEEKNNSG